MKNFNHNRIIKKIIGSILISEFSESEILQIRDLFGDKRFLNELMANLEALSIAASRLDAGASNPVANVTKTEKLTELTKLAQISQKQLIAIIYEISEPLGANLANKRISTRELIERCVKFLDNSSLRIFEKKLSQLGMGKRLKGDSYLDLITDKLREADVD